MRFFHEIVRSIPILVSGIFLSSYLMFGEGIDDSVRTAAQNGVQAFLQSIPQGAEMKYGFHGRQELSSVTAGAPVRMYTLQDDSLRVGILPGKDYLVALEEWRVPVMVGGEARALLTVTRVDGHLKIVQMGGAELAQEFAAFDRLHPNKRKILLRLFGLHCDFMIIPPSGGGNADDGAIFPLRSARVAFPGKGFEAHKSNSFRHILPIIRQKLLERPDLNQRGNH